MRPPRLEAIELEYGCHSGRFELPDEGRPVVIAGRNGSGKTTLLEALLRGLYGFSRRRPEERRLLELRRPWSGRPAEATVWLRATDGARYSIHRDFATDAVLACEMSTSREVFRGDGNPVGVRSESRRYQDLIREWIGFGTLEPYRGTAWIAQGELVDTKLDDELLRAAAGTHRRVEGALKELRDEFEALTREPLEPGGRGKRAPRDLEDLRDAVDSAVRRLEEARQAKEDRRPLLDRAGQVQGEIDRIEGEIALLEAAYRPITERRTLLAEEKEAEAHLATLTDSIQWVREAAAEVARTKAEAISASMGGQYPEDFEARLGQATALWDRRNALENRPAETGGAQTDGPEAAPSPVLIAGGILIVSGAVIAVALSTALGAALAAGGALLLVARFWLARSGRGDDSRADELARQLEEERESVRTRLGEIARGVPAPELTPESVSEHRARFRRQEDCRAAERRALERSAEAAGRAARLLDASEGSHLEDGEVLHRLEAVREEARTALARVQLRLTEQPSAPHLPEGVDPTVPAVEAARDERRARRDARVEERSGLELELRDLNRASEDVFALEREVSLLRERVLEAESETKVRRFAWQLVRDAYEQFRATDQDRLLSAVNDRLAALSGGRLGPVTAPGDLTTARVELGGHIVALESPPLSYGERHAVLLAIRLGAADFVSGDGTNHPLLVDEPFTHLDEVRSREVWNLLQQLAVERQVIVTTQDRLVLDHLSVRPDFDLAAPRRASRAAGTSESSVPGPEDTESETGSVGATDGHEETAPPAQAQLELG